MVNPSNATAASGTDPATYLVTYKTGTDPDAKAQTERGKGHKVRQTYRKVFSGLAVDLTADEAAALASDPSVARVEPDGVATVEDTRANATWGIDRLDQKGLTLDGLFSAATAGAGVYVYVLDTGVLATHTEFAGRVAPGWTAIADGYGTSDCHGHGTHVSGIVGGTTYGVANKATIVPVRAFDCTGSGAWSNVIAGLDYVAGDTARRPAVANLSLGGAASQSVDDAVARAVAFVVNHAHSHYAGKLPLDTVVKTLATAKGRFGSGADYLYQTVDCLSHHGIRDSYLAMLRERVAGLTGEAHHAVPCPETGA